jgi:SAM-dependent methyltransferase
MASHMLRGLNRALRRLGLQVIRTSQERPWDRDFRKWIDSARRSGRDPNDVGDETWAGDSLAGATRFLFPNISPRSVVLELGPGTGRYTRHVLPRCQKMILVDYSEVVCEWLAEYAAGKGPFEVHHITGPTLPAVPDATVDFAFARGVFEHIDPDDMDYFFREFQRVLRPGGRLWLDFCSLMSEEGFAWFERWRPPPGGRGHFRFYHPDFVARLAAGAGLADVRVTTSGRFGFLEAGKS